MAMTSAGVLVKAETQETKQRWNARVERGENIAQMIMSRRAVAKGRNRFRRSSFFSPKRAMSVKASARQHSKQAQQQYLIERIDDFPGLTSIRHI